MLVYRNELYVAVTPEPIISTASGPLLNDSELTGKAVLLNPGYSLTRMYRSSNPNQAVVIWLGKEDKTRKRLFDPRTGEDVGSATATGMTLVTKLIELHAAFLSGPTGRSLNGIAALLVLLVLFTGAVIWWPGVARWRRSLYLRMSAGWKRTVWDVHSMIGFWSYGFLLIFTLSGIYLCFPEFFQSLADQLDPVTDDLTEPRLVDDVLYWLAFLHFGRINGIGIPCSGPGLCDQSIKAIWALFGLVPAVMFVTGFMMWWNRELRRWRHKKTGTS